jgi:lactate racemase
MNRESRIQAAQPAGVEQAVADGLATMGNPGRLTIILNDPQRHTDSRTVLDLLGQVVDPRECRILIATGSHSIAQAQRLTFVESLIVGSPFGDIAWHDARSPDLVRIPGGWACHPWLVQDRPLFAIGSVEPHYFAGFTGAHKTCTIGCCGYEDIQANHAHALEPTSRPARLEGNPVFDGVAGMLAALQARQTVAAVNLIQSGRRIIAAAGGEPLATLKALVPAAEKAFVRTIDMPAEALVADVAGPLARTFYQADKGIKNNEWAVRDGGVLVLSAACPGGIGQDEFVRLLRDAPTYRQAVEIVQQRGYRLGDHKAVKLRYLTDPACRNVRVFAVCPGLSEHDAAVMGLAKAQSVEQALLAAGVNPANTGVLRVADAGNTCVLPE